MHNMEVVFILLLYCHCGSHTNIICLPIGVLKCIRTYGTRWKMFYIVIAVSRLPAFLHYLHMHHMIISFLVAVKPTKHNVQIANVY